MAFVAWKKEGRLTAPSFWVRWVFYGKDLLPADLQFLLAGVARHMEGELPLVEHVRPLAVELIDDAANGVLVARNGGGRDDDPVAGADIHLAVGVEGHAGQGGHGLPLTAGGDDADPVLGQALNLVEVHQDSIRDIHIAQLGGDLHGVLHAAASDGHPASIPRRHIDDLLEPVHIGGEGGDDDALLTALEQCVKGIAHAALTLGKPGRSTLVESASRARTPSLPSSPSRARSIMPPWMGVVSILKSPVWTTVPTGHLMAKATASAMEWLKVLSLVLCVAVMLSVMVVGAGAAFSDQSKIKNTEAVDACVALNIIGGYGDNTYRPENNITRAEVCKMICVALNGGKEPTLSVPATPTFKDVRNDANSAWAEKYIESCVAQGIVGGVGNGNFEPSQNVAGAQLAKMLLVGLGYKADNEGFGGANLGHQRERHCFRQGPVDVSAPLTRDDAAQMIWNALNAYEVEYKTSSPP